MGTILWYINLKWVFKQAFSEARQKVSPEAFIILQEEMVKKVYTATDLNTYKGYRLSAIDGSTIELQNTKELREAFGYAENGKGEIARAKISEIYDMENNIIIDAIIDKYDTQERELAIRHIEKLKELGLHNDPILFDRGYPSKEFIATLIENNIKFLMRVSKSFIKEVNNVRGEDNIISYRYNGK